jgi:hypothetical protein
VLAYLTTHYTKNIYSRDSIMPIPLSCPRPYSLIATLVVFGVNPHTQHTMNHDMIIIADGTLTLARSCARRCGGCLGSPLSVACTEETISIAMLFSSHAMVLHRGSTLLSRVWSRKNGLNILRRERTLLSCSTKAYTRILLSTRQK